MIVLYASHALSIHDELFLKAFRDRDLPCVHVQIPDSPCESARRAPDIFVVSCSVPRPDTADSAWVWLTDAALNLRPILDEVCPDVVLAGPIPTVAASFALAGAKNLVALSWGSDVLVDAERAPWIRAVTRYALRSAVGAIGDCRAVRERILEYASELADRCLVIPWGVDVARFAPGESGKMLRRQRGWEDCTVLISTRRFEPGYGIDVLLDAFSRVIAQVPDVRLLLCGEGSQRRKIAEQIQRFGLQEFVFLAGAVPHDELPSYFQSADLYVSSALSDGSSVSLLEAMACGLPAVVSAGFGNVDWINDRVNGWLAPPGDVAGLTRTLLQSLDQRATWRQAGIANRAIAMERANWQSNQDRLVAFLETFGQAGIEERE